jgi:hypothetical protein
MITRRRFLRDLAAAGSASALAAWAKRSRSSRRRRPSEFACRRSRSPAGHPPMSAGDLLKAEGFLGTDVRRLRGFLRSNTTHWRRAKSTS